MPSSTLKFPIFSQDKTLHPRTSEMTTFFSKHGFPTAVDGFLTVSSVFCSSALTPLSPRSSFGPYLSSHTSLHTQHIILRHFRHHNIIPPLVTSSHPHTILFSIETTPKTSPWFTHPFPPKPLPHQLLSPATAENVTSSMSWQTCSAK